jgi:hypothetical protein
VLLAEDVARERDEVGGGGFKVHGDRGYSRRVEVEMNECKIELKWVDVDECNKERRREETDDGRINIWLHDSVLGQPPFPRLACSDAELLANVLTAHSPPCRGSSGPANLTQPLIRALQSLIRS